ncbi:MFS transporter [Alkalihalophilus sp. As8PL]|uniref:MFS transporter n=1 Tax=Alkalihalophilus sp. As8PL TaxID=3237103 RepID=A0AB39BRG2_9BACI
MRGIHKGWMILTLLFFTMLASLGFGRFSLGAILPFMREGIGLDYKEMGFVASAAFIGYLISVAVVGYFVIRFGSKLVINISLFIIIIGMIICANAVSFSFALLGCLLLGVGSGGSSIPAMGLAGKWFSNKKKGMAIGIAMGGVGLGIVISGLLVPSIVSMSVEGWRFSWYILALVTSVFIFINALFLKNAPEDIGLKSVGEGEIVNRNVTSNLESPIEGGGDKTVYRNKKVWVIGFIYLSWGFSYLVFSTFLVDYLMIDVGYTKELAGLFFSIAGIASIASGFIWGVLSDILGRMYALSLVLIIQFAMLIALSFTNSVVVIGAEVVIYGLTLWGVPTIMNASVADFVSSSTVPIAMGFVTIFFSVGQIISPIVTGLIIESTNQYFGAFILSAVISLIGGLTCLRMHYIQHAKQRLYLKSDNVNM